MRVPGGGGASCLGVGHPGSGALPPPTTRPFGRAAGAHYPLAVGAGDAGVGTCHRPHSTRSCELALRAVGAARGRPGGAPLDWVWGVRGRALSQPGPPVLSGVRLGPTTHWLRVRGVRAWKPVTNPKAGALASWLCALWGRHEGARGGRLLPGSEASGIGHSPTPDLSSFRACGRGPLPTGCGCGGCGRGDLSPTPQGALLRAGFALCGGDMGVPGGGASCLGVGRPGSGALPAPTTGCFRRAAEAHHPLAVAAGVAGVGTRHQPHSARSCELPCALWGRHQGARGGGRLLPGCGASGVGRSPTPDHSSFRAWGRGRLPTGCGCGVRTGWPRCPWCLFPRRGSSCVVRASRVCGTRWQLLLGTRSCAVVVAGGVPHWRASWPRVGAPLLVRSGRSQCSVRLSRRRGAFPHPEGCCRRLYLVEAGRVPGSLCLPLAPAVARALGSLRVVPVRGPALGSSLAGLSGFLLGLRALQWLVVCGPGH